MVKYNKRYTVQCYAECCEWRLHASRLVDGKKWAIKKIWPDVHNCRGLETYNPICTVKWDASEVMEDIRADPDIPSKALNELLCQRFGIYMKQASLYKLKRYVIQELFGGHDESYTLMPRPLIGVDGAHLKGNYGGILLSAVALDGNNEFYPIAYAIVRAEDKESWAYYQTQRIFGLHQQEVDLSLTQVWPDAKRRYCSRHLSRNYKKDFLGAFMYTLFWRLCNATNKFTFRKAMEKLQKEGGDDVMTWFADLGD
ncbi:uncharacterized protein LOC110686467 [Chenopodium quinoa]|uniref:uncharacterized protein LOC110686467 n=1 Tax=Chenopodium quinoa TaxID=63459 RepID=UPI000B776740|nr:uncharacterized protein LOC110686467 [Chenopodium quinoa]